MNYSSSAFKSFLKNSSLTAIFLIEYLPELKLFFGEINSDCYPLINLPISLLFISYAKDPIRDDFDDCAIILCARLLKVDSFEIPKVFSFESTCKNDLELSCLKTDLSNLKQLLEFSSYSFFISGKTAILILLISIEFKL